MRILIERQKNKKIILGSGKAPASSGMCRPLGAYQEARPVFPLSPFFNSTSSPSMYEFIALLITYMHTLSSTYIFLKQ